MTKKLAVLLLTCWCRDPGERDRADSRRSRRAVARRAGDRARPRRGARRAVDRGSRDDRNPRHARGRELSERFSSDRRCVSGCPAVSSAASAASSSARRVRRRSARRRVSRRAGPQRAVRARPEPGRFPDARAAGQFGLGGDVAGAAVAGDRRTAAWSAGDPSRRPFALGRLRTNGSRARGRCEVRRRARALTVAAALIVGQPAPAFAYLKFGVPIRRPADHRQMGAIAGPLFRLRQRRPRRHRDRFPERGRPRVRHVAGGADRVDHLSVRAASPRRCPAATTGRRCSASAAGPISIACWRPRAF